MARKPERNHEAITSQASSLKITNLMLILQYGLMVINFDCVHIRITALQKLIPREKKYYLSFLLKEAEGGELVMSEFSEL